MLDLNQINSDWTLILDRDGVINHEKYEDYIYNYKEFKFYDGVLDAMKLLAERFGLIIIITNQRGVGKGLMTDADLQDIHSKMVADISRAGGRIDGIYFCTSVDDADPNRKPNTGMFLQAQAEFPDIIPAECVMVGNNLSDMEFGRKVGMHTVFVKTTDPEQSIPHELIDLSFPALPDFAKALQ